jgi:hypothetical protein
MAVNIPPEYANVWKYFEGRKTPVSIKQAVLGVPTNEMHARRALEHFVFAGLAIRSQTRNEFFYRIKR